MFHLKVSLLLQTLLDNIYDGKIKIKYILDYICFIRFLMYNLEKITHDMHQILFDLLVC